MGLVATTRGTNWSDMVRRLLTIGVGAPVVIGAMVAGAPYFDALMLVVGVLLTVELARMFRPTHGLGLPLMMAFVVALAAPVAYAPSAFGWGLVAVAVLAAVSVGVSQLQGHPLRESVWHNTLTPLLGAVYVAVPVALLVALRGTDEGRLWVSLLAWVTWFTDSWALIGGRLLGRTKLAPSISPGKTVEGALVGLAFGVAAGTVIMLVVGQGALAGALLAALVGLATVAGDLFESALKRHFRVKDAGGLLPGHGGFLDRMDGLLVSTPLFCLALVIFSLV